MELNYIAILVAALVPTVTGMIYYNPKLAGGVWIRSTGKTSDQLTEGMNMPVVMIVSLIMSLILSMFLAVTILGMHEGKPSGEMIANNTFVHGMLHGAILSVFTVLPILTMNGMYERRTWSNTFVHFGYWFITMALMGGIVDAWV